MSSHLFSAPPALQQRRSRGPVRIPGAAVFRDEKGLQRDDASAAPFAHSHFRQRQLPGPKLRRRQHALALPPACEKRMIYRSSV